MDAVGRGARRLDRRRTGRPRHPWQHAGLCQSRLGERLDIVIHNECLADVTTRLHPQITAAHRRPAGGGHSLRDALVWAATIDDWREFLGVTSRRHTKPFNIPVKVARQITVMKGSKQTG